MLVDPTFEIGAGWTKGGTAANVTYPSTDFAWDGTKSLKVVEENGNCYAYQDISVTEGQTLILSAYIYLSAYTDGGLWIKMTDTSWNGYAQSSGVETTGSWQRVNCSYEVGVGVDTVRVVLDSYNGADLTGYFDAVMLEDSATMSDYCPLTGSESPSLSPSVSPSVSPSASISPSVSLSISPSVSPSASISPSLSPSISPSVSPSVSPSASISPSVSPSISPSLSPSVAVTDYTRGDYAVLPSDETDLETNYSAGDVTDVETENSVFVGQTASGEYAIHKWNDYAATNSCTFTEKGRTNQACWLSPVVLQIYNFDTSTWETLDTDSTTAAGTLFTLTAYKADLTNYKDGSDYTHCRSYQLHT